MTLRKWNYDKREYEPYEVPNDWKVKTHSYDFDEVVNCCQCGVNMYFGDSYTSHEVHTEHGMGYAVCPACYFGDENVRYYADRGIDYDPSEWLETYISEVEE